jgi:hydroxymethylpyrimidine pyrophosphatase-like HAD family hydrolase
LKLPARASPGIPRLCVDCKDIEAAQVMAFGDNHNDAPMLKLDLTGIAMGNASSLATDALPTSDRQQR